MLSRAIMVLAIVAAASGARANEYGGATAAELTERAKSAVETGQGGELLSIMKEMQRRRMFFFEGDEVLCRREPPKVGVLAKPGFNFGTARTAYQTYNKAQRVEDQDCTCPQAARSFREFSVQFLGVTPEQMTEGHMAKLREYNQDRKNTVADAYRTFRNTSCREEY